MTMTTLTDGMTDKEILDFVRETLGANVADAAKKALDSESLPAPETFVMAVTDNGSWQTYTVVPTPKESFDEFCEAVAVEGKGYSRILEVTATREALVTRTIDTKIEELRLA